jgi:thiol-disulfide isomerase/thioredoxin
VAATLRVRLAVLAAAVGISAVGAVVWSNVATSGQQPLDAVLDEPGAYVDPAAPTNPPLTADALPDVMLVDAAGDDVALTTDGRPMVVNLWFSTCAPCTRELPAFAAVHGEVGDRVRFVGVNPYDSVDAMQRFASERGVDYELLRDPDEALGQALGVVAYPVSLFVAADGTILDESGPMDSTTLRNRIEVLFG